MIIEFFRQHKRFRTGFITPPLSTPLRGVQQTIAGRGRSALP